MKSLLVRTVLTAALSMVLTGLIMSAADGGSGSLVEIESGNAVFEAVTNMPGIEVKGKSGALSAHADVLREGSALILDRIEASVPVKTLATGMKVRDEHMRKYIFTTADGQEPDLRFAGGKTTCGSNGSGREFTCRIAGTLSIRGVARPLAMNLSVKEQGGSHVFRAAGDGIVKLSDYGIEAPSQFGVKPSNEVKIHLEFAGKEKPAVVSNAGVLP